ncbi:uncharacterized protein FA14DRAFT_172713 [Meira miltonrushii]|uniref:Uncharacterized protein n=1 Tax=Meira miltonrushii TaxID=1280837 RepID=A0A316VGE7_9BASI|nr:uncharacterized protein FA14DRAFT_172713 [Meira miltonrushii]PWN36138.1 hypothetical protein FA14DRAFT_172713 [Meira miltonrushii]
MLFAHFSLVIIASIFGFALAGPINLVERSSGLSCKPVNENTNELGYGNFFDGANITLGKKYDEHGQWQVTQLEDGAEFLSVNIRYCSSAYLNISDAGYSHNYGYVNFGKVFLAEDDRKCLQRHETLPSSEPNRHTHITIEDCSNVDDSSQLKQFWYFDTIRSAFNPLMKTSNKNTPYQPMPVFLSDSTPPAVLTSRTRSGQENSLFFPQ